MITVSWWKTGKNYDKLLENDGKLLNILVIYEIISQIGKLSWLLPKHNGNYRKIMVNH